MLVAIGITAVLAALCLSAGGSVIRRANQAGSASNLRQIVSAFHTYCGENDGRIPGVGQNTPYVIDSSVNGTDSSKAHGQNTYLHRDMAPYLGNSANVWRAPGDKIFFHNYYYGLATSYGNSLGAFAESGSYIVSAIKLPALQGTNQASRKAIFADISWEMTSRIWNGYDLGDGYNVAFLDGHVGYYKRTGTQGRYRSDW